MPDNLSAAIVSTVKVEDPSILSARIEGYDLILSGEKLGDTSFTLAVNSNGRVETKMVSVHVTEVSGIEEAESLKIVASPNPVRDILTVRACVWRRIDRIRSSRCSCLSRYDGRVGVSFECIFFTGRYLCVVGVCKR